MAKAILRGGGEEVKSPVKQHSETATRWAVLIRCADGREWLASGTQSFVSFFRHRAYALKFADELAKHVGPRRRLKVVKVKLTAEML